ncbi:MAG: hypothetical protein AAB036_09290 [Elusimicrobiota bacterium]
MNLRLLAAFALTLAAAPALALEAAVGKIDITPDLKSEPVWMAGFGSRGRRPTGIHDRLHARLLVLREGPTTVALAGLDLLGFYIEDSADMRSQWGAGQNRHLFVHATHQHSGPDTLGLWGPMPGVSGKNRRYEDRIKRSIVAELKSLEARLVPVRTLGAHGVLNPRGLCRDSRDPQVIDPNLGVLRFEDERHKAVATIVNWSCHPEVLGRENRMLTADFPGPLCDAVERATGGGCLFLNGMIGGLLTPDVTAETFDEAARVGRTVADAALALKARAGGNGLAYHWVNVRVPVENSRYLLFLPALTGGHRIFNAAGQAVDARWAWLISLRHALFGLPEAKRPWVETEVGVLDIGPARILGLPGEAFPELAIGGYDGRYAFGLPVLSTAGPHRDLAAAPKGPYLRELVKAPVPLLVGLANDELGYFVPNYDFRIRPSKTMLPRLPGHYEETNSVGPTATKLLTEAAADLLRKTPRP